MTKNFSGFPYPEVLITGCSEVHYRKPHDGPIDMGFFGVIYSDSEITVAPKESKYFKARKHHIKFSNGEELFTISRYRKSVK